MVELDDIHEGRSKLISGKAIALVDDPPKAPTETGGNFSQKLNLLTPLLLSELPRRLRPRIGKRPIGL
jgi:hypothetical protein